MFKMSRLFAFVLVACAATAQAPQITQVPAQMLRWLVLDVGPGGTPVLNATTVVPPPIVLHPAEKTVVTRCDAQVLVFAIPDTNFEATSMAVYCNGLLMASPDDYTVVAQNVVFTSAQAPQASDIVQLRYHLIPKQQ